jgi:diaminohydroxyphosphoribosylaminopyrimidine deaminase/5-amino-6-(5-phosphoribosylamino)uracil reductase
VARVVVACDDPSPFAAGRGAERLLEAGIPVEIGLLSDEALVELDYGAWFLSQTA